MAKGHCQREDHKYGSVAIASKNGQIVPIRRENGNLRLRWTIGSTPYHEYVQDWKQLEGEIHEGKMERFEAIYGIWSLEHVTWLNVTDSMGKAGLLKQRSGGGMLDLSEHMQFQYSFTNNASRDNAETNA